MMNVSYGSDDIVGEGFLRRWFVRMYRVIL